MKRAPVKSSAIRAIGYEPESKKLHIEFSGGNVYEYDDIEPEEHAALIGAGSVGAHFTKHIARRDGKKL